MLCSVRSACCAEPDEKGFVRLSRGLQEVFLGSLEAVGDACLSSTRTGSAPLGCRLFRLRGAKLPRFTALTPCVQLFPAPSPSVFYDAKVCRGHAAVRGDPSVQGLLDPIEIRVNDFSLHSGMGGVGTLVARRLLGNGATGKGIPPHSSWTTLPRAAAPRGRRSFGPIKCESSYLLRTSLMSCNRWTFEGQVGSGLG
jgi:hypothetical protein